MPLGIIVICELLLPHMNNILQHKSQHHLQVIRPRRVMPYANIAVVDYRNDST